MQRRLFLKSLVKAISALSLLTLTKKSAAATIPSSRKILLQTSPVAGFQFYDGDLLWNDLHPNDPLQLVPEPENSHDNQAVKVIWNDTQLGYVPRQDNTAISQMLNRRQMLVAGLANCRSPGTRGSGLRWRFIWCRGETNDDFEHVTSTFE